MDRNTTNSTESTTVFYVAYGVQGSISVVGMLANFFIIFLVGQYPTIRSVANVYVANLAVADFGFCLYTLVQTPLSILEEDPRRKGKNTVTYDRGCDVGRVLAILFASASVFHLTAIAVERYNAISKPLDHLQHSSMKRAARACLMIWTAAFLTAVVDTVARNAVTKDWSFTAKSLFECVYLKHLDSSNGTNPLLILAIVIFLIIYVIPACIMIPLYTRVFLAVKKSSGFAARDVGNNTQAVRMVLVVTVFFLVCWLPFHVTSFVIGSSPYEGDEEILHISWAFALINSVVNPFLYALFGQKFRTHVKRFFESTPCRKKRGQTLEQSKVVHRGNTSVGSTTNRNEGCSEESSADVASQSETTYL